MRCLVPIPPTRLAAAALVMLVVTPGCRHTPERPPEAPPPVKEVVSFAGCAAVTAGANGELTCELGPTSRELFVRWAGQEAPGRMEVAPDATELDLGAGRTLRVAPRAETPELLEAEKIRRSDPDRARALLAGTSRYPEPQRALGLGLRARLFLAGGHAEAAIGLFRQSMALHRKHGRVSNEVLDGMALVYTLLHTGRRFVEARRVLESLEGPLAHFDEGRARIGYYHGLLARDTGNLREALAHLEASARACRALGLSQYERNARQVSARLLQTMGRGTEALDLLRALRAQARAASEPCGAAHLSNDIGWTLLMVHEAQGNADDPGPALQEALAAYQGECSHPMDALNTHVNLALRALQRGDLKATQASVTAAKAVGVAPDAFIAAWLLDVEGRVAIEQGRLEAAADLYGELRARSLAARTPESLWRAELGLGRTLRAAGRLEPARAALERAEALLSDQTLMVPLGEGRATFLGDREASARALVGLLLQTGDPSAAFSAARRARARAIQSFQRRDRVATLRPAERAKWDAAISTYRRERDALNAEAANDWQRPANELAALATSRKEQEARLRRALDQAFAVLGASATRAAALSPPAPGELVLAYAPLDGGWTGFAATAGELSTAPIVLPKATDSARAKARALLDPFDAQLSVARRVRILPHGPLQSLDFHALPYRGGPLIDRLEVVYGADLGGSARGAVATRAALVVADPSGDLPAARREGAAVQAALAEWPVVELLGPARATSDAVRQHLAQASLVHFAGHGELAGRGGWDSRLRLASGASLAVGDILALPRVPAAVVLSGCETAATAGAPRVLSISLAHAFLAAGAEVTLAALRPVEDELASGLAGELYRGATSPDWNLAEAFQSAIRVARKKFPRSDWAAFRVVRR